MNTILHIAFLIFCGMIGGSFSVLAGAIVMAFMGVQRGGGGFLIPIALIGACVGLLIGAQNR